MYGGREIIQNNLPPRIGYVIDNVEQDGPGVFVGTLLHPNGVTRPQSPPLGSVAEVTIWLAQKANEYGYRV